jgi:hypothetical protein
VAAPPVCVLGRVRIDSEGGVGSTAAPGSAAGRAPERCLPGFLSSQLREELLC